MLSCAPARQVLSPLHLGRAPVLTGLLPAFFNVASRTPSLSHVVGKMLNFAAYAGLFSTAFIAATIFPLQSEAVLVGMIFSSKFSVVGLVIVASIGNVLGAMTNWFLGRCIERFRTYRWFPLSERGMERSTRWYRRYGKWSLLLSWMPIIGDGLTVIAGVLREPLLTFTILVSIAKTGRYVVLALATLKLVG